jgi:tetratricopeptide (TPR) repeat protein
MQSPFHYHSPEISVAEVRTARSPEQAAERQFVTQLVEGALATEPVVRTAGNQPTTAREVAATRREVAAAVAGGADARAAEELLSHLEAPSPLREVDRSKAEGNRAFKEHDYAQALVHYVQAAAALGAATGPEADELRAACLSNRAACQLKLGRLNEALADADACLAMAPARARTAAAAWRRPWLAKAAFRRGVALHALGRYGEACPALCWALELHPLPKVRKPPSWPRSWANFSLL